MCFCARLYQAILPYLHYITGMLDSQWQYSINLWNIVIFGLTFPCSCAILITNHTKEEFAMTEQNVCRFVPRESNDHSIHTVHFVLETEQQIYSGLRIKSLYTVYLVTRGTGKLHTQGDVLPLHTGDIFFTFPAVPFAIESVSDFQYMYISFFAKVHFPLHKICL